MRIALVSGSHRLNSGSVKVAGFLIQRLKARGVGTYLLDLGATPLPFWDEGLWEERTEPWCEAWAVASGELARCDAVVIVSPEWGGHGAGGAEKLFSALRQQRACPQARPHCRSFLRSSWSISGV